MDHMKMLRFSKNLNVLYVEDHEDCRTSTYLLLEDFFNEVIVAEDGLDGLEKMKNFDFDLIITDIMMPNMNGIEMIKEIKKIDTQIPIIILSAYSDTDFFVETIKLGIDGYILKPMNLAQSVDILSKVAYNIYLRRENIKYIKMLEEYRDAADIMMDKQLESIG